MTIPIKPDELKRLWQSCVKFFKSSKLPSCKMLLEYVVKMNFKNLAPIKKIEEIHDKAFVSEFVPE